LLLFYFKLLYAVYQLVNNICCISGGATESQAHKPADKKMPGIQLPGIFFLSACMADEGHRISQWFLLLSYVVQLVTTGHPALLVIVFRAYQPHIPGIPLYGPPLGLDESHLRKGVV